MPTTLFDNLLHFYYCYEGAGTSVGSTLGTSNKTGTLTGNAAWAFDEHSRYSVNFPGFSEGGYGGMSCAAPSGLANASQATISMNIKLNHVGDYAYSTYSSLYEGNVNYRWEMHGGNSDGNTGDVWCFVNNGGSAYGIAADALDPDYWHNLAMVFDGTQTGNANRLKLYVDGGLQELSFTGTIPTTLPNLTTYGMNFGRRFDTIAPGKQQMQWIGVWNRVLTPSEIQFLYVNNVGGDLYLASPVLISPGTTASVSIAAGDTYIGSFSATDGVGGSPASYDGSNTWWLSGTDAALFNLDESAMTEYLLSFKNPATPGQYAVTANMSSPTGTVSTDYTVTVLGGIPLTNSFLRYGF